MGGSSSRLGGEMKEMMFSISRFTALTALAAMSVLLLASCSEDPGTRANCAAVANIRAGRNPNANHCADSFASPHANARADCNPNAIADSSTNGNSHAGRNPNTRANYATYSNAHGDHAT